MEVGEEVERDDDRGQTDRQEHARALTGHKQHEERNEERKPPGRLEELAADGPQDEPQVFRVELCEAAVSTIEAKELPGPAEREPAFAAELGDGAAPARL